MYSMNGMGGMDMSDMGQTLVLNANNELVQYVFDHKDDEQTEMFCQQLYDLAMISHQPLPAEKMTEFIQRSNKIMMLPFSSTVTKMAVPLACTWPVSICFTVI